MVSLDLLPNYLCIRELEACVRLLEGNKANGQAFAYLGALGRSSAPLSPGRLVRGRGWLQPLSVLTEIKAAYADEKRESLCFLVVNQ